MVQHFPTTKMQSGSVPAFTEFCNGVNDALTAEDLRERFSRALELNGVSGHVCYALDESENRSMLLSSRTGQGSAEIDCGNTSSTEFAVRGWDDRPYIVEVFHPGASLTREDEANLHTMSVLYLCRLLTLVEAKSDTQSVQLTTAQRRSLEFSEQGVCDLDAGEQLGISAFAVQVHRDRAQLKMSAGHR